MIERDVSKRFWEGRAQDADDPRAVTLDGESASRVAGEVALYQRWLFRRLDARGASTESVADLGCGNGDWTAELGKRARRLFAVDFSAGFVEHVGKRVAAVAPGCEATVVQSDLAAVELEGPFDLVVFGAVSQYLDDAEVAALLAKVRATLDAGGTLYFRSTVAQNAERRERKDDSYQAVYRQASWYREAIVAAGFSVEDEATATNFVAEEWVDRRFGKTGAPLASALRLIRRGYRRFKPTDVYVCLARPI